MELQNIFRFYGDGAPLKFDIKDTSHGKEDFRQAVFAEYNNGKIVIKICCNDFTSPRRIECWANTADAYNSMGIYCPQIIKNRNGKIAETVLYNGMECTVWAEEFSIYNTSENFGDKVRAVGGKHIFHDDLIRLIGKIGSAKLDTADFPSGICIIDKFCPSDPCDEIMETALDFKNEILNKYPQFKERFSRIWDRFIENKGELVKIYSALPCSVFQADLNRTNILIDDNMNFKGLIDFNLCGRETVLNCLFREVYTDFHEDIPYNEKENPMFSSENDERVFNSLIESIQTVKATYTFSEIERKSAILLYRYLRPFWWQAYNILTRVTAPREVELILNWIEKEQTRNIDFENIMA